MPARFSASHGTWIIVALLLLLDSGASASQAQEGSPAAANVTSDDGRLARIDLLLEQGRLDEAWQEALAYRGPEPYEIFHRIGVFVRERMASRELDAATRARIIDLGIEAETRAMAVREDAHEAVLHKSVLLREKAKLTFDPKESQALIAEADHLRERATQLQSQGKKTPDVAAGIEPPHKGKVTRPEKIWGLPPDAGEAIRRLGVSGTVILEVKIDEKGNVEEARVFKSLHPELDQIALDTIRTWKFKPATHEGKPVKVYYTTTMNFH